MREVLNCPNCGAPIAGDRCPYCGTVFYDFASIDMDKPSYIKMRLNGHVVMFKGILRNVGITHMPCDYYADNTIVSRHVGMSVSVDFDVIPDKDVTYTVIKE